MIGGTSWPRWPEVVALALLFLLYTRLSDLYQPPGWPLTLNQLAGALVLCAMLVWRLVIRREPLVTDRVLGWMLAYAAAMALSSAVALGPSWSIASPGAFLSDLLGLTRTLVTLEPYLREVLVLFMLTNLITTVAGLRRATWVLVAGAVVLSAAGVLDAATGYQLGGMSSRHFGILAGDVYGIRLAGPIRDANTFAQVLVVAVPLALYRTWGERRPGLRLIALAALLLLTVVIVWTFSRQGFIALFAVLAITATWQRFKRARLLPIGLALVVFALAAPQVYWHRVSAAVPYAVEALARLSPAQIWSQPPGATPFSPSPEQPGPGLPTAAGAEALAGGDTAGQPPGPAAIAAPNGAASLPVAAPESPAIRGDAVQPAASANSTAAAFVDMSLVYRSKQLRVGLEMFRDQPLTGVGRGNYFVAYPRYYWRVDPTLPNPTNPHGPHNMLVHIAAETGLIGLTMFVSTVVVAVLGLRGAKGRFARAGLDREAQLLEAIEIAIYGYLIGAMFLNDNLYQRSLWLLIGLAVIGRRAAPRPFQQAWPHAPAGEPTRGSAPRPAPLPGATRAP